MDINKILKSDYLDIVFDGRNKAYGGYDLRRKYSERMKKSGIAVLALCLIGFGYNVFANRAKKAPPAPPPPIEVTLTEPPPIDENEPPKPPPPAEPPPPMKPTVAFTPPEIKKDEEIQEDKQMVDQSKLEDATAGLTTQTGDVDGIDASLIDKPGEAAVVDTKIEPEIATFVEQNPEFPGGDAAFTKFLQDNMQYPQKAQAAGKGGIVRVKFVVDTDGSISTVSVSRRVGFGLDEEAMRVVGKMPKWSPGKNNGKPVKCYFVVPINFQQ